MITGQTYICLLMMQKYVDKLHIQTIIRSCRRLNKIQHWSDAWLLKLNVDKCKVVSYGRQVEKNKYVMVQNNCIAELQRDAYIKDLGVVFDEKLNFSPHISERINKAYSMLWLIRRNFRDIGPAAFVLIYKHLVRSHLEYNNSVWAPYRKLDIYR